MHTGNELEYLDIYDAGMRHIGVVERLEAHRKGYWHKTFHCWVLCERSDERTLILQRRDTQNIHVTFTQIWATSVEGKIGPFLCVWRTHHTKLPNYKLGGHKS